jgi:hypothetical protein
MIQVKSDWEGTKPRKLRDAKNKSAAIQVPEDMVFFGFLFVTTILVNRVEWL